MNNKVVSLLDLVKLVNNEELSEPYVRYTCGIDSERQYRHQEISDIATLLRTVSVTNDKLSGFIYGYVVPQLNKEFDLLRITQSTCLNIELKSDQISSVKIARQLYQNRHYLKLLNRPIESYTFVSSTGTLMKLDENNCAVECSADELSSVLSVMESEVEITDLDDVFTPSNILVSPFNATERFLQEDYLLTENQENIKKDILSYICGKDTDRFVGLTGGPGTGKTLLIYDIARELAKKQKVLMVHSGILCEGQRELNEKLSNIRIISAKDLRLREIKDVEIVIVDEAHRLYLESLEKVERWVKRSNTTCLFSYDAGQMLSIAEKQRNVSEKIDQLCSNHSFKLKSKIRTNRELALFISCLRDLSQFQDDYRFPNVRIVFEPNQRNALNCIEKFKQEGYTFISYTPSRYNHSLDYQSDTYNTHNVIGQEFDSVCMIIDDNLYYDQNRKLKGRTHPNPDYLFEQLLYQGITRVRKRIALVVVSETVLKNVLPLMKNS